MRIVANVDCQGKEAHSDDPQRFPLNVFTPGWNKIVVKPPEQSDSRRDLDQAVQAETDERDGSGDDPGHNGDQRFEAIPDDVKYSSR